MSENTNLRIRQANADDANIIANLVRALAQSAGETTQLDDHYARIYLAMQGCGVLLAEQAGEAVGLLSYSMRPNLYHAKACGLIEELVVREDARGHGIGTTLIHEALRLFESLGCAEVSISTMPENEGAQRLYRALGFTDEAVLLEKHFEQ
jgi:ribosomal protein S18 acetylase RimI-like enzyme